MEQLQERFLKKYSNADAVKIITNSEAAEGIMKGVISRQRCRRRKRSFVFSLTIEGLWGYDEGSDKDTNNEHNLQTCAHRDTHTKKLQEALFSGQLHSTHHHEARSSRRHGPHRTWGDSSGWASYILTLQFTS
jgi:hypothetical protein